MKEEKQCVPSQITIEMVNVENIIDFLNYIENVRNNSIKSIMATLKLLLILNDPVLKYRGYYCDWKSRFRLGL